MRGLEALPTGFRVLVLFDDARFDSFKEALPPFVIFLELFVDDVYALLLLFLGALDAFAEFCHQGLQPLLGKNLLRQLFQHQSIELLHRQVAACAGVIAPILAAGALVIAILPALARDQGHRAAAYAALEQAGKQGGGVHKTRRGLAWSTGFPLLPDALEGDRIHDGGDGTLDPFLRRTVGVGLGIADIGEVFAHVERVRQQLVGFEGIPRLAAHQQPFLGEMLGDLLASHRVAVLSAQIEVVGHAHDASLRLVDNQLLALPATAAGYVGRDGLIAEGRRCAVEEALSRVLLHGAGGVLGILFGLMLVEQVDDAAHHFAARIVAGRLCDRNDLDLVLRQLTVIHTELDAIAEEAGQAVDDDGLECRRFHHGIGNHLLEHRPLIIGGRCARFDIFLNHQMAVGFRPFVQLAELVGDGQVVFRLARGGYSRIQGNVHFALRGNAAYRSAGLWLRATACQGQAFGA